MSATKGFQPSEMASIRSALEDLDDGRVHWMRAALAAVSLSEGWLPGLPGELYEPAPLVEEYCLDDDDGVYRRPPPAGVEPDWVFGMTHEFRKAIRRIDRKLQGRVLQAIGDISTKPTVPRGDTVKPLSGELEGFWRYRIGDFRLIYRPNAANREVILLTVVGRGSAYT